MRDPRSVIPERDGDDTEIVPATAAAATDPGRIWFDDRLRGFVDALASDHVGAPRTREARQALAAAARDLIDRIVNQRPDDEPAAGWPRDAVLQPHQLLANTFEVRMLLASGGVGQIYRVRHRDLRTEHAVKILLPRHVLDPALNAMFMTEARLLATIRHPGVASCLGLLRDGDGRLLFVMEHVRGSTLAARLREAPLGLPEALSLARGLLLALDAVHAAGVVHNDLSPGNIMLRDDDCRTPVLVDFGLATALDAAATPEIDQVDVDFAGKLSWMSPERLGGRGSRSDARSDLYSLGLVLVAAVTGRHLPMGTDAATASAARRAVPPLDGVPGELRPLLTALLQPDPAARPPSAEAARMVLGSPARPKPGLLAWLARGGR